MDTTTHYPELSSLIRETTIIGVDIDGVLSDTIKSALEKVRKQHERAMDIAEWISWSPHEIESLRALGMTHFSHTVDFFYDIIREENGYQLDPIPGSQTGIRLLQSRGKILMALSGRGEETREWTEPWIHRSYPGAFSDVFLANTGVSGKDIPKYEFVKRHRIGLMIEDNAKYALDLATKGSIPTILFDAPWNIGVDTSEHPTIYRLPGWNTLIQDYL